MTDTATLPPPVGTASIRKPRLGFAGVGWIGRNRLEAIAATGCAEIAAIADPLLAAGDELWSRHEAERLDSFDALLEADLDGIVIATPSALHAAQSVAALEAGIAVFCQKPLGRNAEETAAVIVAAERADRLLGVDLSYRFTAGMQAIRREIAAGNLGTIHAVEAVFHNAYGPDKPWFYRRSEAGGGCLLDLGIHLVDLALWCLDFPEIRVATGDVSGPAGDDAVECHATGQVSLAGGASLQLACSWGAALPCDAEIGIRFFGSEGSASFRNVGGSFYDFTAGFTDRDRKVVTLASPPDDWGGRAAANWARRLARDRSFDPGVAKLPKVSEVLDSIYQSARHP